MAFGVTRNRLAWLLLAPLLVFTLYGAVIIPSHSCPGVDGRTYIEMIRGVSDHGLPYLANGPSAEFPELRARWNSVHDGRLWGTYPPLFAYAAVPFFRLGGLEAVSRFNAFVLAMLVLGCFALGRRYTRDPIQGTATAYVAVLSTAASSIALDICPYVLLVALIAWGAYFAVAAIDDEGRAGLWKAAAAGALAALGLATHVLAFPVLAGLVLALGVASIARGAYAIGGAALPVLGLSWLNHVRFDSCNPVTYGPCTWRPCIADGLATQSVGTMLWYVTPVLVWALPSLGIAWAVRRSRVGLAAIVGLATLVLVIWEPMRRHGFFIGRLAWAYIVDSSTLDMRPFHDRASDGLGNLFGPFVLKSTLQSTPAFALAFLAPFASVREKRLTATLAVPCVFLFGMLALRTEMPIVHGLGFPFLYLRYVLPAVPMLAALSVAAVAALPWRTAHFAMTVGLAGFATAWLLSMPDDIPYARRVFILRVTLLAAAAAVTSVLGARISASTRWKQGAILASASAFAFGFAVTLGVDLQASTVMEENGNKRVDAIARLTPQRFALIGGPGEIDTPLALRASRDIEYADLSEGNGLTNARTLIDRWTAENRPIYTLGVPRSKTPSPWPDVAFAEVGPDEGLVLVTKLPSP